MNKIGEAFPASPVNQLGEFVTYEQTRMATTLSFLAEALPVVEDLPVCNQRLVAAGRPDLVISAPAVMGTVTTPLEVIERCNNFTPNFEIKTGVTERVEDRSRYGIPPATHYDPIPITSLELDSLAQGNMSFELDSHASKPAYVRMLVLFPEFTKKLTLDFSEQGYGSLYRRYGAELFAAYQLMSRLVDQSDPYVMHDGEVNDFYLCS